MIKKVILLLLVFSVQCPVSALATSVGLNVINNPSSAGNVPDNQLKNWMVFAPESPQALTLDSISAPNVVVRLHSAWTETGVNMLSKDSNVQSQVASAWCRSLNALAQNKQRVFAEPFNELDKDYERDAPDGKLDLNTGINRAKNFISHLRSCLNSSVTLTSPALDPQNGNFTITRDAFLDFDVISIHPYTAATAHSYNSGPLAGKEFLFTEVGTVVNGRVVYDDCEFIKFFCGQSITEFWQNQSDIIAYFLFTFAPGDYDGGSWEFTNPNVAKALRNDCSTILSCKSTGRLPEGQYSDDLIPDINIGQGTYQSPPRGFFQSYEAPDPQAYSNIPQSVCNTSLSISETFKPKTIGGSGSDSGDYQEYDVNEIGKDIEGGGPYSNYALRGSSIHYAKMFPLNVEYHETAKEIKRKFTTYGSEAVGAVAHSMPYADKLHLRGRLIEDVASSLEPDPALKENVVPVDEQIAWACGESLKNLFPKPEDPNCRPITVSEVGYFFSLNGNTSYEIDKKTRQPVPENFPQHEAKLLEEYYHCPAEDGGVPLAAGGSRQCGYFKTYPEAKRIMGGTFEFLEYDQYSLLYNAINVIPRGSTAANYQVDNIESNGAITTKSTAHVLPLSAPIGSQQLTHALNMYLPYQAGQVNSNQTSYCQNPSPNEPIQDSTSSFTLAAFFKKLAETIFGEPKTITRTLTSRYVLPETMVHNMPKDESFLKYMIPYSDQKYYNYNATAKSSFVQDDDQTAKSMPQPGLRDAQLRNSFNLYLKPYSWTSAL